MAALEYQENRKDRLDLLERAAPVLGGKDWSIQKRSIDAPGRTRP